MWSGLHCITDYKKKNKVSVQLTTCLMDDDNIFYSRFDVANNEPAIFPHIGREATMMLILERVDVRQTFKKANPHKALGPDGIPGCALRVCVDQLAEVFSGVGVGGCRHPTIYLSCVEVDRVSNFKFLSVNITEDHSWTTYINIVVRKARKWFIS